MGLALSTSWNAFRHTTADGLLSEIIALGFTEIELSFNLTVSLVKEIEDQVRRGRIKVSSVHNFCPVPEGFSRAEALPDCYSMASTVEWERRHAIEYTKRSIDTACRLNARAVVLHCGRVAIPDRMMDLAVLYERGRRETPEYESVFSEIKREREASARPFFEKTLQSLDELNAYARTKGVYLGIETRFYHREIPSFEEFAEIFARFKGSNIHYWHDAGHAEVTQRLGVRAHKDFLDAYGSLMCGMHLHDVAGCRDHKAPLKGEIDFTVFKPYFTADMVKVIEAHYPATAQDLKESKRFLERLCNENS